MGIFKSVLHLPTVEQMLISIAQLSDSGIKLVHTSEYAIDLVNCHTKEPLTHAHWDQNLYWIWVEVVKPEKVFLTHHTHTSSAPLALWHRCLSHISKDTIQMMVKKGVVYFITFTDDFSHYTHIGFCKSKDKALAVFKAWKAWPKKETSKSLKILCTDGRGEYTSSAFNTFLAENGIKRETTNPYTPQENGVSEQANHTINNLAHSMIADAHEVLKAKSLPPALWSQAVQHAVWIKNCTLTWSLNSKITLYQSYFGKLPSLATLHLFGCKAYAHIPKIDQTKLGECSIECIHIGFADKKRAYILYLYINEGRGKRYQNGTVNLMQN